MTPTERRKSIIDWAWDEYAMPGRVEIDRAAKISEGSDNGCYVAAWVWVSFEGTEFDKEKLTCP